jgi:hypothetical protein
MEGDAQCVAGRRVRVGVVGHDSQARPSSDTSGVRGRVEVRRAHGEARFRKVYPGVELQVVADWLIVEADRWLDDRSTVLTMPAPQFLGTVA